MSKKIFYGDDARTRLLGGIEMLYKAVRVTYGPLGDNVVIGRGFGGPSVTHDGVTVAESIEIKDVDDETLGYSVGAELVKQAAGTMNKDVGDGTTTVTVLTYHILKEANRLIATGHKPQEIRKGIETYRDKLILALSKASEDVSERIVDVASISAGNPTIGKLIADLITVVGRDGVIEVEEGQTIATTSEVVEGYTFQRGFTSPFFITDLEKQQAIFEAPAILLNELPLTKVEEIMPFINQILDSGRQEILLVTDVIEGEAFAALTYAAYKDGLRIAIVKAPGFGDSRQELLHDLAVLTGATVVSKELYTSFEKVTLDVLGTSGKVTVGRDSTTIINGGGNIKPRLTQLKAEAKSLTGYDLERINARVAALSGKVAIIKVGGASETEIEELKYRIDDAVCATKAALAEGIVAGGGTTLLHLSSIDAEGAGEKVLQAAIRQPFIQIMENSGIDSGEAVYRINQSNPGMGINVRDSRELVDMKAAGIIDPTRVTKQAVLQSVSIAATACTMGALICEIPEE